ncbi:hypothetical protein COU88_05230 [Candidatus Roizmanbacteria bacterium CG10_big_fil_rev_8_21_14_0_10_39_6]|uniref:Aspartate kinase n=1 Tax=Candidatus Roizmanbacteria bacterium CG10_big_fil_rev_8_21_14_0_10_39_6 TaxID=1974853 RepID=A0A2M8KR54_9BACT|nr:MAG: hypothetical protein COU88_05230 [Candidatus Roizmanbacteria bacterium CG10_big_fil_rev_8_21_14_0_10_39_6]
MITVPQIVKSIVHRSPYIGELLKKGIINHSALAREIKPQVEEDCMKRVELGSIVMALKRLDVNEISTSALSSILTQFPDLIVRSGLIELTLKNSKKVAQARGELFEKCSNDNREFITITQGVFETTIITAKQNKPILDELFLPTDVIMRVGNLSSITVRFHVDILLTPGVYYMILKVLALNVIAITEVVSTYTEITIVLPERQVERAFALIKQLFSQLVR